MGRNASCALMRKPPRPTETRSGPRFDRRLLLGVARELRNGAERTDTPRGFDIRIGGHGTEPYEQNTQQSPNFGLSRSLQPLQL
jgi:hypothetical protein